MVKKIVKCSSVVFVGVFFFIFSGKPLCKFLSVLTGPYL